MGMAVSLMSEEKWRSILKEEDPDTFKKAQRLALALRNIAYCKQQRSLQKCRFDLDTGSMFNSIWLLFPDDGIQIPALIPTNCRLPVSFIRLSLGSLVTSV